MLPSVPPTGPRLHSFGNSRVKASIFRTQLPEGKLRKLCLVTFLSLVWVCVVAIPRATLYDHTTPFASTGKLSHPWLHAACKNSRDKETRTRTHTYTNIYIYIYIHRHTYINICTYIYVQIRTKYVYMVPCPVFPPMGWGGMMPLWWWYVCMYVCMDVCKFISIYIYIYVTCISL